VWSDYIDDLSAPATGVISGVKVVVRGPLGREKRKAGAPKPATKSTAGQSYANLKNNPHRPSERPSTGTQQQQKVAFGVEQRQQSPDEMREARRQELMRNPAFFDGRTRTTRRSCSSSASWPGRR
jgi:hypothetical protein